MGLRQKQRHARICARRSVGLWRLGWWLGSLGLDAAHHVIQDLPLPNRVFFLSLDLISLWRMQSLLGSNLSMFNSSWPSILPMVASSTAWLNTRAVSPFGKTLLLSVVKSNIFEVKNLSNRTVCTKSLHTETPPTPRISLAK